MMEPIAEVVCLLKVDVHCDECKLSLMRVLSSISGVYSVEIDGEKGTATVVGEVEPNALLGAVSNSGKHAQLARATLRDPRMNRTNTTYGTLSSYASSYSPYYNNQTCDYTNRNKYYGYQTCPRALSGYGYNQEVNSYGGYRPPPAQYASSSYPLRRADEYIAVADPSVPLCTIM
ncbi:hypothetical protein DM860_014669 [Cuscuta australis]|uniref:HMA domain-containing protein n=1 Tax=Cuscuta australis TaxID=267555 RepID=A0A328DLQ1_9ASTE|nr:hypothetical protein DM860_014669 [Cuscuta australis]